MSRNSCCHRQISLLVLVLAAAVAMLRTTDVCAEMIFSKSYLMQTEDPRCMLLLLQTHTSVCDVTVNWGYTSDNKDQSADVYFYKQNIVNEYYGTAAEDFTLAVAEICGAGPGLRIYYEVKVSFQDLGCSEKYNWTNDFVLPLHPSAKHVTFYGYGDTRSCGTDFKNVSQAIHDDIVNDAHPTNLKTFLLHSGDVVYNGGQTFEYFDDSYWNDFFWQHATARKLNEIIPIVVAMGNHDFNWAGKGNWPKYFYAFWPHDQYEKSIGQVPYIRESDGKLVTPGKMMDDAYYSLDYGPVHVAVVNNYTDGELEHIGGCYIGSGMASSSNAQYKWLENDLEDSDKDWKIIMMHVPIASCGCLTSDANADSRQNLEDLASLHGAYLIVVGHAHYYLRTHLHNDNITQLLLGGGGATLDSICSGSSTCPGCYFHYAKFHVLDDYHMKVTITKVNSDGSTSPGETFTFGRYNSYDSTGADFTATSELVDYHTPVRFFCTTDGVHRNHKWDMGDGGTSSDENPLHYYPKPVASNGYHPYTVTMSVTPGADDDGNLLTKSKTIQVYKGGGLAFDMDTPGGSAAIFVSEVNTSLKVPNDLKIFTDPFEPGYAYEMYRIPPGEYQVLVRTLGYKDWNATVTVKPEETSVVYPNPDVDPAAHNSTFAIGSVPTGLPVTVDVGTSQYSGTTPLYLNLCTDDASNCSTKGLSYTVTNGQLIIERSADYNTGPVDYDGSCYLCNEPWGHLPQPVWVDARSPIDLTDTSYGPIILRQPSDQEVRIFGSALLRVDARAGSPLTYRWFEGESGDTSHPIIGATSAVYATPQLVTTPIRIRGDVVVESAPFREVRQYWVRVYSGTQYRDSRTVTVSVASKGPRLTLAPKTSVCHDKTATLHGNGFNADDSDENRVYFDDLEAYIREAKRQRLMVFVPHRLTGRETAAVRVRSNGVWSNPQEVQVLCSDGDVLSSRAAPGAVISTAPKHKGEPKGSP